MGKPTMRLMASLLVVLMFAGVLMSQWIAVALADMEPPSQYIDADLIRVGISDDDMTAWEYPTTRVTCTGPFTVKDKTTGMLLLNGQPGEVVTVTVDRLGFYLKSNLKTPMTPTNPPLPNPDISVFQVPPSAVVNSLVRVPGPLLVEPLRPQSRLKILNITRRKEVPEYRGIFEVARGYSAPNKLTVINVVSLEDYLKAVVPNELPMRYGWEAVKAQAVAARNYAVRPREKPWKHFDICDSQLCQVYFGSQTETRDSNQAVADTEGLVGLYDGEPILALFSSAHGGVAENYSYAFSDPKTKQYPAPAIPYLQGGPDVPLPDKLNLRTETGARRFWTNPDYQSFDVDSSYYRWKKQWSRASLETAINQGLLEVSKDRSTQDFVRPLFQPKQSIGTLQAVHVKERGVSGKAMVVDIVGSHGTWTVKKEFLIRKVFSHGGRMLPSANVVFTPTQDANGHLVGMIAQGGGFGHGVGMSQLGASWMHKHGYQFPQIIQHYYRGASLGSLPVSVGEAQTSQPVLTRFRPKQAQGMLWVQEGQDGQPSRHNDSPVTLRLNGKMLTVSPTGFRSGIEVDDYLRPGQLNTLVLYPDSQNPSRKIKAWVELYPAQSQQKLSSR